MYLCFVNFVLRGMKYASLKMVYLGSIHKSAEAVRLQMSRVVACLMLDIVTVSRSENNTYTPDMHQHSRHIHYTVKYLKLTFARGI